MVDALKKRILVIDDERDVCEILKVKLQNQGFEVNLAHDGSEGFKKVLQFQPDCVLLDIRMSPGEDGLTFLRKLRSYRDEEDSALQTRVRRIPVIILTAASGQMQPLFQQEGISGFIEKPFDAEVLKNLLLKATA